MSDAKKPLMGKVTAMYPDTHPAPCSPTHQTRRPYSAPRLERLGDIAQITAGFQSMGFSDGMFGGFNRFRSF